MEIKTCEQYVLAELEDANERIYELSRALEEAEREIARLREQGKQGKTEQAIAAAARKSLFISCFNSYESTKGLEFRDWCLESLYSHLLPKGVSKLDFIEAFEPEFREEYDERLAEEEEE